MDKFPVGVIMNKGLTVRTAQQHGQKYVPKLLEHTVKGELDTSFLATHQCPWRNPRKAMRYSRTKPRIVSGYVFVPQPA